MTTSLPGYREYEYLLILSPHEELVNRILTIKQDFATTYKLPTAKVAKPHIALLQFLTWSLMEEKVMQRLQTIAMGTAPFKVELKDYGSLPTHTIYVNVTTKVAVQNLIKDLRQMQSLLKTHPDNKPHFITEPYIAIAQKLKPWQYEQGWSEYSHKHFSSRFIADAMLLLKRPAGEKGYQIAKRFEFMNLPVTAKQGELFG